MEPAPPDSIHARAARVIAEQHGKMLANVAAAVDGRDPEGVHDMRVATRRLRAALELFAPWLDRAAVERIEPAVRSLTRALGRVRELDVLRLRLAALARRARPERALAIECVDARLARRRSRARARMMARFAKVDLDRLDGRLRRLESELERSAATSRPTEAAARGDGAAAARNGAEPHGALPADEPIAALVASVAAKLLDEARAVSEPEIPGEVGSVEAAEALHRVRIAAKKLRYALEILAPYLGEAGAEAVRRLRALQDELGDFHDDVVLDATLRRAIERAAARDRVLLAAELRRLRAARRRVLARDEREVRAAIARLCEEGFTTLVARALEHGGAGAALAAPAAHPPRSAPGAAS